MAETVDFLNIAHYLGKGEVDSSILSSSTTNSRSFPTFLGADASRLRDGSCRTLHEHVSNFPNQWGKIGEVR